MSENSDPAPDEDSQELKERSLRDAVLCIGWFKMMSVTFYICLFFLTKFYTHGFLLALLLLLVLSGVVPSVFLGVMLFLGSLQECQLGVLLGWIFCYIVATYDLIIGLIGAGYHVLIADDFQDYVMTLAFILLSLTSIPAYFYDAYIINSYRKILVERDNECCSS